jgi:hypothetical protein
MCIDRINGVYICQAALHNLVSDSAYFGFAAAWCIKNNILISYFQENLKAASALGFNAGIRIKWEKENINIYVKTLKMV